MTCRHCGNALADGAMFCANCGGSVADAPAGDAVATAVDHGQGMPPVVMEPGGDQLLAMVKKELGNDYAIEKELGRGGMAVVYKGVERALERIVAIKVVPPESANAGQAAERFRREARLAASLDHPNIIPVYRVGQAGPLHYMAMKFVEGRAVDAIIDSQGALPMPVVIAILRYSAAGLAFAHERKIVHRDIKGANILVDKDGRVMVSDFGIARALEEVSLTASGMVIGTPYYMSPEQCGGQKISPQSDQYSLGVMGFQMLTGEVPFNAESMVGVIQHHYMTPVPDITAVRSDAPKELLDIIYCSLNKAPEDRFTTTREMAQALENIPQSDQDREEAEKLLRELSAGLAIPKVRTGTLPPLHLTISGPSAPVVPRPVTGPRKQAPPPKKTGKRKKKKSKMAMPLLLMGTMGALVLGFFWFQAGTAPTSGKVVFAGLPTDATDVQVLSGDRVLSSGDTVSVGRAVPFTATATGYKPQSRTKKFTAGHEDTVVFAMDLDQAPSAPSSGGQTPQNTFQSGSTPSRPQAPAASNSGGDAPAASSGVGEVRISVIPLSANILIDDVPVGSGRVARPISVGSHVIKFQQVNCVEPQPIQITKGQILTVSHTMTTCGQ